MTSRTRILMRSAGLCLAVLLLWWGSRAGIHELLTPERIRDWGWPGWGGYVILMGLCGGVGLPPVVFMVPASAVWPPGPLFLLNMMGGFLAAQTGFWLSRHFLRNPLASRIPDKVLRYEHRLESHGFSTVLILRVLFFLFPPINWMLGISDISRRDFVVGTLLGMLPWTLVYTLTGHGFLVLLRGAEIWQLGVLAAGVGAGLAGWGCRAVRDREDGASEM